MLLDWIGAKESHGDMAKTGIPLRLLTVVITCTVNIEEILEFLFPINIYVVQVNCLNRSALLVVRPILYSYTYPRPPLIAPNLKFMFKNPCSTGSSIEL
jgi:hypothetical protein